MKKITVFTLALAIVCSLLVFSVAAENEVTINVDLISLPHNTPLKHPGLMVIGLTDTLETLKIGTNDVMSEKEMVQIMEAALADPECTLIPEDCQVNPSRIRYVETRRIVCEQSPYFVSFRVWGTEKLPVMVFFRPDGSEEWTLVACGMGTDIQVDLEENGFYAVGAGW